MAEYYVDSDHLLQGPNVIHRLLPEAWTQSEIHPWSVILHSNAGVHKTPWLSLWKYMFRSDITLESHIIGPDGDGVMVQAMPFNRRADCNAKANSWLVPYGVDGETGKPAYVRVGAISFETQDNGGASLETTPWNLAQFNALVGATAAIGHKYAIPYQYPLKWNDTGVGYHSQFPEWSIYVGKTCPGAARIRQMSELHRRAAEICAC